MSMDGYYTQLECRIGFLVRYAFNLSVLYYFDDNECIINEFNHLLCDDTVPSNVTYH